MAVPERILEAEVDAELLRRNRLGESHAALARAFGCSKSLVQRRITRAAKLEEAGSSSEFVTRTIKKVLDEETTRLENGLSVLATIGATAPFVSPIRQACRSNWSRTIAIREHRGPATASARTRRFAGCTA